MDSGIRSGPEYFQKLGGMILETHQFIEGYREEVQLRLADCLKGTDFFISVIGHTDSQQPTPRLAERYPTNWELGGARASVAARFLQQNGVELQRISAESRAETVPLADNSTAEGRAKNRQIQIVLRKLPH